MSEQQESSGGLDVEPIVFGGLLLVLIMVLVVVGTQAWIYDLQQEETAGVAAEQAEQPPTKSRWANEEEGTVRVGIDRAMEAVAARHGKSAD